MSIVFLYSGAWSQRGRWKNCQRLGHHQGSNSVVSVLRVMTAIMCSVMIRPDIYNNINKLLLLILINYYLLLIILQPQRYTSFPLAQNQFSVRLRIHEVIGEGNFGRVFRGEAKDIVVKGSWTDVAIKMCKGSLDSTFHLIDLKKKGVVLITRRIICLREGMTPCLSYAFLPCGS